MPDSLWPHGLQHARLLCLLSPGVCPSSCPWSGWCYPIPTTILYHPLLLFPWLFLSIRVFPNESAVCIRWPKYWSFSFRISFSNEYSGLISFRIDLFNYPSMIFWRACLFSIEYSWLPCQTLADWIWFGLFMGSPFSSIGVFVWFYASTKRYWWL